MAIGRTYCLRKFITFLKSDRKIPTNIKLPRDRINTTKKFKKY
jgi:hypothetical protein